MKEPGKPIADESSDLVGGSVVKHERKQFPLEFAGDTGKCFYTGKDGARKAIFAKAY